METIQGRTRGVSDAGESKYEFLALTDLTGLGSLSVRYLQSWGEDLSEEKLRRFVADLLYDYMTENHTSQSYRWVTRRYENGFDFIQRFEDEALLQLRTALPLWREYRPEDLVISIESHLGSSTIGYKEMLPGITKTVLSDINQDDKVMLMHLKPIAKQEFIIDFSKTMSHEISEPEFRMLNSGKITWAYLIEECIRINLQIDNRGLTNIGGEKIFDLVVSYVDVDELRTRFENTEYMHRVLVCNDIDSVDAVFDSIWMDFARIIYRILYNNEALLKMVYDQAMARASLLIPVGSTISMHITNLQWMGQSAMVELSTFDTGIRRGHLVDIGSLQCG